MTREQLLANRQKLIQHLEQCKELIKPQESFYKKYNFRLFWSLQRPLSLQVRGLNGLVVGVLLMMAVLLVILGVAGQTGFDRLAPSVVLLSLLIGEGVMVIGPTVAGIQVAAMEAKDARNGWSLELADKLPGVHKICFTEKGLNKLISYIKSGRANSLDEASQLYVDAYLRKFHWLLRGLNGIINA